MKNAAGPRSRDASNRLPALDSVPIESWRALAGEAIEPNAYYLPEWELAVNATAPRRTDASVLSAWCDASAASASPRLIGLLPVISAWRAWRIPLPALASADPYGTLSTPLLDHAVSGDAIMQLLRQARETGARAIVLRDMSLDGLAMQAIGEHLREAGLTFRVLQRINRACLDATHDADDLLRSALDHKKLKELRRQRNRLADHGEVSFHVARSPDDVASALEIFLTLEASGWKGRRGTALRQNAGDTAFIRRATRSLAERGACEIVVLRVGDTPVAAGIVPRHVDRAYFFKIGIDERFAKFSPGVQLTLELTRHLCADPAIASADSTASAGHPMIDPMWRGRLGIGDVLIPLRPHDPVVSMLHAALSLRRLARDALRFARRLVS